MYAWLSNFNIHNLIITLTLRPIYQPSQSIILIIIRFQLISIHALWKVYMRILKSYVKSISHGVEGNVNEDFWINGFKLFWRLDTHNMQSLPSFCNPSDRCFLNIYIFVGVHFFHGVFYLLHWYLLSKLCGCSYFPWCFLPYTETYCQNCLVPNFERNRSTIHQKCPIQSMCQLCMYSSNYDFVEIVFLQNVKKINVSKHVLIFYRYN